MYSCSIHYTRMIVKFVPAGLLEGGGGGGVGGYVHGGTYTCTVYTVLTVSPFSTKWVFCR